MSIILVVLESLVGVSRSSVINFRTKYQPGRHQVFRIPPIIFGRQKSAPLFSKAELVRLGRQKSAPLFSKALPLLLPLCHQTYGNHPRFFRLPSPGGKRKASARADAVARASFQVSRSSRFHGCRSIGRATPFLCDQSRQGAGC